MSEIHNTACPFVTSINKCGGVNRLSGEWGKIEAPEQD